MSARYTVTFGGFNLLETDDYSVAYARRMREGPYARIVDNRPDEPFVLPGEDD